MSGDEIERIVSQVSQVFCSHSLRVMGSRDRFRPSFSVQSLRKQPVVKLRYGVPTSADAGDFEKLYLVCHTLEGNALINQGNRSIELAHDQTVVLSPGLRTKFEFSNAFAQISVRLDQNLLENTCRKLLAHELDEPIRFLPAPMSQRHAAEWRTLLSLLDRQHDPDDKSAGRTIDLVDEFLVSWLLLSQKHSYSAEFEADVRAPEPAIVRKAERIIRESGDAQLTSAEVAHKTGVSLRTLQAAFKTWRSTTPSDYIRGIKLDRARQKLLEAQVASIADVAFEAGFIHIGRFGESYRRRFGETPGTTAKRARRLRMQPHR